MAQGNTTSNFTSVDATGGFYVNGTQVIDSSGNVIVGTSLTFGNYSING